MAEGPAILVIGPSWVGDMVMAQCLFAALKELHPDHAIDVVAPAWAAPLLGRMPEVRARIDAPFKRREAGLGARWRLGRSLKGRYARAYVMPGSWKSALVPFLAGIPRRIGYIGELRHVLINDRVSLPQELKRKTAEAFFRLARGGNFRAPRLEIDAENQARLLAEHGLVASGFAALMPGAEFGPAKRWPPQSYAALARALSAKGMAVVLLGSANDAAVTREIAAAAPGVVDLAGRTRLEDAIDLTAAASVAVSNDSGLMHIAAAVGTPVVAVYGSTSPNNTPPLADHRELVWLALECSPCHAKTCPLGHMNCLNTLAVETVLAAVERLLAVKAAA